VRAQAIGRHRFAAFDAAWPSVGQLAAFVEAYIRAHPADFFAGA
jgi:hypothetical protein